MLFLFPNLTLSATILIFPQCIARVVWQAFWDFVRKMRDAFCCCMFGLNTKNAARTACPWTLTSLRMALSSPVVVLYRQTACMAAGMSTDEKIETTNGEWGDTELSSAMLVPGRPLGG